MRTSIHPINEATIATAAWNIPQVAKAFFPEGASHLQRYAQRLNGVEINSSFYKHHQAKTYERWRKDTPDHFRFAVKLAKVFTHEQRLERGAESLIKCIDDIRRLENKLSVLLVQLPPSLPWKKNIAEAFFDDLRRAYTGDVALEPRHPSWNQDACIEMLREFEIARVIADPQPISHRPAFEQLTYLRLHGSPQIYKSAYSPASLELFAQQLQQCRGRNLWCVFDNTTFGHATLNALWMRQRLSTGTPWLETAQTST